MNVVQSIQRFLNKYGFRCINELKLEENTLHDDPGGCRANFVTFCVDRTPLPEEEGSPFCTMKNGGILNNACWYKTTIGILLPPLSNYTSTFC